ncbi:unnamed protein product [Heterobilharzia americana]|nr:unnamed protein product [Heterobilharzia americana]
MFECFIWSFVRWNDLTLKAEPNAKHGNNMEFGGSLEEFIRQEVTVITGEKFSHACSLKGNLNGPEVKDLPTLLDMLGEGSAKAQRLPGPVTTHSKFKNTNHKIFLLSNIPSKRFPQNWKETALCT